jgi:hypothetical protein
MKTFFPNILNPGKAFTGSAQSFKFIHNNLQIRVHQLAAGPNPETKNEEKNSNKTQPNQSLYRQSRELQIHSQNHVKMSPSISCWV